MTKERLRPERPNAGQRRARRPVPVRLVLHGFLALGAVLIFSTSLSAGPIMFGLLGLSLALIVREGWGNVRAVYGQAALAGAGVLALAMLPLLGGMADPSLHALTALQVAGCAACAPVLWRGAGLLSARLPVSDALPALAGWLAAAAVLLVAEMQSPGLRRLLFGWANVNLEPTRLNRPAELLACLLVVALAAAWRIGRLRPALVAGALALALGVSTLSESARLVLAVGLPLALASPRLQLAGAGAAALGLLALGLLAFTPFYDALPELAQSWQLERVRPETFAARLDIWRGVSAQVAAHPLGAGFEATRQMAGAVDFSGAFYADARLWHPHNLPLQLLLDLGWLGFATAFALVGMAVAWAAGQAGVGRVEGAGRGSVAPLVLAVALTHNLFAHSAWHISPLATALILAFLASWLAHERARAPDGAAWPPLPRPRG